MVWSQPLYTYMPTYVHKVHVRVGASYGEGELSFFWVSVSQCFAVWQKGLFLSPVSAQERFGGSCFSFLFP